MTCGRCGITDRAVKSRSTDLNNPLAVVGPSPDSRGERATDGLAGRLDDRAGVAATLRVGPASVREGGPGDTVPVIVQSLDTKRGGPDDNEAQALLAPGPEGGRRDKVPHTLTGPAGGDDPLLPLGLDSHRYRCCGNGVVAPVAEFVGERLASVVGRLLEAAA